MSTEVKAIGPLAVADGEKGEVTAVVNTLNMVDRDRDVILPGAIPNGTKVKMSFYAHGSVLNGEAPVGKGVITMEGDHAVFRGNFFMNTSRGREAFETVKALGSDSEWSIGYRDVKTTQISDEWAAKGARRVISKLNVIEVSPVILGANGVTGTLSVKEAQDEAEAAAEEEAKRAEEAKQAEETARIEAERAEAERVEAERKQAELDVEIKQAADDEFDRFQRTRRYIGVR